MCTRRTLFRKMKASGEKNCQQTPIFALSRISVLGHVSKRLIFDFRFINRNFWRQNASLYPCADMLKNGVNSPPKLLQVVNYNCADVDTSPPLWHPSMKRWRRRRNTCCLAVPSDKDLKQLWDKNNYSYNFTPNERHDSSNNLVTFSSVVSLVG